MCGLRENEEQRRALDEEAGHAGGSKAPQELADEGEGILAREQWNRMGVIADIGVFEKKTAV